MPKAACPLSRILTACLFLSVAVAAAPQRTAAQSQAGDAPEVSAADAALLQTRQVPVLTLRNRTGSDDPGQVYGDERSVLRAGSCQVRELGFGGLGALAGAAPAFIREEFLRVAQVDDLEAGTLLDRLQDTAADRGPVIYVHGYYIGFEKGCRRAVLLQENARLGGRFIWSNWPSDGARAYCTHDEADLYWTVPDLADAIIEMERRFGPGAVDVVGHSLGARGVVLALHDVANRNPDIRLGEVVLLAPDLDFAIFQRILPRIDAIAQNMTVYVSTGDRPLAASAHLHGYPRLGETANDVATLSGVEGIDLSELPKESPTGHLYHIYSPHVGGDLDQLLNDALQAGARRNLVRTGPNFWKMRPGNPDRPD